MFKCKDLATENTNQVSFYGKALVLENKNQLTLKTTKRKGLKK